MTEAPLEFYKRERKHGDIPHMTMADYSEVHRDLAQEEKAQHASEPTQGDC